MTTRRNFLINSTLATTGLGLSLTGIAGKKKQASLAVGIVGTGDRGQGIASLIKNIEGMEVLAMCDVIPFRLEKAMKLASSRARSYSDYRKLLEDKRLDAIVVSTPFGMHSQMAIDALDANKHVYCEKTLSYGIEATRKLLSRTKSSDKIFQTGHQYHSSRLYRHIVELVKDGELGELSLIESQWNRNGNWRRPVPDPKWERMINWRMYREYSGGLTAELCSHQIDLSNWILGSPPQKVSGFGGIDYWKDGRETYDNVHLLAEYPNGVKASFTSLTTNAKDNYQIKILGKKGSVVINQNSAWIYSEEEIGEKDYGTVDGVSGATTNWKSTSGKPIDLEHKDPTLQALVDFRDNIRDNKTPLSNAQTGAEVSVVVQMALDAMDNNRVETWKDSYNFI